ncbi:MAG: GNAT family N-acetyltransferase [Saprospirales bacterium]|nr:GNAT family N-acetyltransferase [Saprospirales bacterium]
MSGCQTFRKHLQCIALPLALPGKGQEAISYFPGQSRALMHQNPPPALGFDLAVEGFSAQIFSSIDQASFHWKAIQPADNRFLSLDYLRAVELSPPEGVTPYYLVFFKNERPAGLAYLQLIDFRADESLQFDKPEGLLNSLKHSFREKALGLLRFRLLHVGNLLLTGPRGFYFLPEITGEKEAHSLLRAALPLVRKSLQDQLGQSIQAYVVKDIPVESPLSDDWKEEGYSEHCFLPNMVLTLEPEWKTFDDYLGRLQSKYRVRARRAFRLLDGVERRELQAAEIATYSADIHRLYSEIASSVEFNIATLHPNYFSSLKTQLGDTFHLMGYFLEGELVGFFTTIENGRELEAHFIGFEKGVNLTYQLYLNMLFDMIRMGIEKGSSHISFARTAMEIKSSVGAVSEQLKCYIRHTSPLTNTIVGPLVSRLQPAEEWEARHPFK